MSTYLFINSFMKVLVLTVDKDVKRHTCTEAICEFASS